MKESAFYRHRYQFAALAWALLIFVLSSIPGRDLPDVQVVNFDKVVHMGIYGCLAILVFLAFRNQQRYPGLVRFAVIATIVACSLYGVSDELHQILTPGRTCDILDWTADTSGAVLGAAFVGFLDRKRRNGSSSTPA